MRRESAGAADAKDISDCGLENGIDAALGFRHATTASRRQISKS